MKKWCLPFVVLSLISFQNCAGPLADEELNMASLTLGTGYSAVMFTKNDSQTLTQYRIDMNTGAALVVLRQKDETLINKYRCSLRSDSLQIKLLSEVQRRILPRLSQQFNGPHYSGMIGDLSFVPVDPFTACNYTPGCEFAATAEDVDLTQQLVESYADACPQ